MFRRGLFSSPELDEYRRRSRMKMAMHTETPPRACLAHVRRFTYRITVRR
jgi:hypothetical protein